MNTDLKPLETTTTTVRTTTPPAGTATAGAPTPARTGWFTSLRRAVRTRQAHRSDLSRDIAAYPAMRSAAMTALLTGR